MKCHNPFCKNIIFPLNDDAGTYKENFCSKKCESIVENIVDNKNGQVDTVVKNRLPSGKELRDLARRYAEEDCGEFEETMSLYIVRITEDLFIKVIKWLKKEGF